MKSTLFARKATASKSANRDHLSNNHTYDDLVVTNQRTTTMLHIPLLHTANKQNGDGQWWTHYGGLIENNLGLKVYLIKETTKYFENL